MHEQLKSLKARLQEIADLQSAAAILEWDQTTYMPPGGAAARGRQLATLRGISQQKEADPALGRLLDSLESCAQDLPSDGFSEDGFSEDGDTARLLHVARRDFERAIKIPSTWVEEFAAHSAASYAAWTTARPANDFAAVAPLLEKSLDLSRQLANPFPGYEHIADPLIDLSDYAMRAGSVKMIFEELRSQLVPLVESIGQRPLADDRCLRKSFDQQQQIDFGLLVAKDFGLDTTRSRQDRTYHPFMTKFALNDVRITTRVQEDYLAEALFSTLHETGHALYELGGRPEYEGTSLSGGTSSGVHESQSRLWENIVGRSRPFWQHYYPQLQETFPEQLNDVPIDTFYRAINKVQRSVIRTDADEVTYNLHVMIRFDLELALLEGSLAVAELPDAWHARYESDLGVRAKDNTDGVLQDVHWYAGTIGGAFQGYTLGNIMGAQFFEAAVAAHPQIVDEMRQGRFETLHDWLTDRIYRHGRKYSPTEIVQRATGKPLSIAPYLAHLREKYGALYELQV